MSSSASRLYRIFASNSKPSIPSPLNTPINKTLAATSPPPSSPKPKPKPKPNPAAPKTFNATVQSILNEQNLTKLVEKFKQSSEYPRFRYQIGIYEITVRRLAEAKKLQLVEDVLEHQKKYNDITKEGFAVRLIHLYGKVGMFEHAYKVFDEMPQLKCQRTVMSFSALLSACLQSKMFDKAVELFRQVPSTLSITPDARSYNIVIQALCQMGSLESANLMLDEMEGNGVKPTLVTFNTLINGFYSNAKFADGDRIWARMGESGISPDIVSYNAKLGGLVGNGMISEAVKLVEELSSSELKPTIITYNVLIKWYCRNEKLDEAKQLYDILLKNDCIPNRTTFEALIPCIYEKGDIDLALKLCMECVSSNCFIDVAILKVVVEGLMEKSKVVEAEKLVTVARSKRYGRSTLKMPSKDE